MSDTPRTDMAVMEYQKLDYGDYVDAIAMRLMERELAAEKLKRQQTEVDLAIERLSRQQVEHERDALAKDTERLDYLINSQGVVGWFRIPGHEPYCFLVYSQHDRQTCGPNFSTPRDAIDAALAGRDGRS